VLRALGPEPVRQFNLLNFLAIAVPVKIALGLYINLKGTFRMIGPAQQ
jgi:hypothetical protein